MDGAESVRSARSERSSRSHNSHRHHHSRDRDGSGHKHRKHHRHRSDRNDDSRIPDENRSVSIRLPTSEDMQHLTKAEEHVEVQILPQDDNWADNTTAMTSEAAWSDIEDMKMSPGEAMENSVGFQCSRYVGAIFSGFIAILAFISPIAMVALPKFIDIELTPNVCNPDCEGYFISFAFKLLILMIGSWALFVRRPKASLPRVFAFRALILFLLFLLTFAYWLFYATRIIAARPSTETNNAKTLSYTGLVQFASSMVDGLLFVHYAAIILIEIRHLQTVYCIKIVRSPDGQARTYNIGQLSVQRAAVTCLEYYYRDFSVYNPYLENAIHRKSNKNSQSNMSATKFKVYDVDGPIGGPPSESGDIKSKAIFAANARRRDSGHNDRYYEEQEYERRVAKRRTRLITAAEESFTHIKRLRNQDEKGPASLMDSNEAAQAIFPSMARSLQKFLRVTRQQPAYPMDVIINHLTRCIGSDMSPKAFLEEFISTSSVIHDTKNTQDTESWTIISESFLSRGIEDGTQFVLKKNDVNLLCMVKRMPYFNLSEKVLESKDNQFVLRLNSETSV